MPTSATPPAQSKYQLRTLHQEIDLFDRKLAHMQKYSPDATPAERTKLVNKRNQLEKAARQLAADGVEFDPKELPRSFQPEPAAE